MSIETLWDVLESIAHTAGIYGGCPSLEDPENVPECPERGCRCCIIADWDDRIRDAVEVERRLYGTASNGEE